MHDAVKETLAEKNYSSISLFCCSYFSLRDFSFHKFNIKNVYKGKIKLEKKQIMFTFHFLILEIFLFFSIDNIHTL